MFDIEKLIFNNDEEFIPNELTIIVGPNNSGKTQFLKDIESILSKNNGQSTAIVLKDIHHTRPTTAKDFLNEVKTKTTINPSNNNFEIKTINTSLTNIHSVGLGDNSENTLTNLINNEANFRSRLGSFYVTRLGTAERLKMVDSSSKGQFEVGKNLLDGFYQEDPQVEEDLDKSISKVFKLNIALDYSQGTHLKLRVGQGMTAVPEDPRKQKDYFKPYQVLDDQGDGLKSFTSIWLSLHVEGKKVLLVDEPEAFLHPTFAYYLGEEIGNMTISSKKVFTTTHSSEFLQGILSKRDSINIIRIDREGNTNSFNQLDSEILKKISQDPLLNSSRILDGLFASGVVVCESDSDSIFYKKVSNKISPSSDIHFVHAQNKQTILRVLEPYQNLGIPYVGIFDIDLIRDKDDFKKIVEALFSEDKHEPVMTLRNDVVNEIDSIASSDLLNTLKEQLRSIADEIETNISADNTSINDDLLKKTTRDVKRNAYSATKWKEIKKTGYVNLSAEGQEKFQQLTTELKSVGVFLVHLGELESWLVDDGLEYTTNKRKWIVDALEHVSSLDIAKDLEILNFMKEIHTYFKL